MCTHACTYKCVYVVIAAVVLKESYTRVLICRQNQWFRFFCVTTVALCQTTKPLPCKQIIYPAFLDLNTHTHSYPRSDDFQVRRSLCKKHFPITGLCNCAVTSEIRWQLLLRCVNRCNPAVGFWRGEISCFFFCHRTWSSSSVCTLFQMLLLLNASLKKKIPIPIFSWWWWWWCLSLFSCAPTDVRFLFPLAGKKVTVRAPAPALASLTKPRQSSRSLLSNIKKGVGVSKLKKCAFASSRKSIGEVQERPLRERVTHLLALRPYKRPELILRLQKDGLTAGDKDTLDSVLSEVNNILLTPDKCRSQSKALYSHYMSDTLWVSENGEKHWRCIFSPGLFLCVCMQVGQLNIRDNTFVLKDSLYKEVRKDWPGYTSGDQQLLKRILVR